jgi:hypothetical protein
MKKLFLSHKPQIESPVENETGQASIMTNERNKRSNSVIRPLLRDKGVTQLCNKKSPRGQGPKNSKVSNESFQDVLFILIILVAKVVNMRALARLPSRRYC